MGTGGVFPRGWNGQGVGKLPPISQYGLKLVLYVQGNYLSYKSTLCYKNCLYSEGSTRRRVARLVLRHNWRHWQRIVFKCAMYPARSGAACDWASEARWIAAEAFFFTILKGTRRGQLLRLQGACSLRAKPVSSKSVHLGLVFVFCCRGVRAEPIRARPLLRHLPSCAASCSQIVFSVPICWPSKCRHVTRRATSRLAQP
jgi:hypothetical protein